MSKKNWVAEWVAQWVQASAERGRGITGGHLERSTHLRALARRAVEMNKRPPDIEAWAKRLAEDVAGVTD